MMQQSISQLSYCLLPGPTDLRPLRIIASRDLAWLDWSVRIHVLGASHAVEFRRGDVCLTEMLTCVRPDFSLTPLIGLRAEAPGSGCAVTAGLTCSVRLTPFCLDGGNDLAREFTEACRMDIAFPSAENGSAPMTRVGWRHSGHRLFIETVHSYPEEDRGVRSESTFLTEGPRE
jgi:hypothetical protein